MNTNPQSKPACAEHQLPEAALVAAARLRDEAAVRELIRRLNGRLFRIARGLMAVPDCPGPDGQRRRG